MKMTLLPKIARSADCLLSDLLADEVFDNYREIKSHPCYDVNFKMSLQLS